MDCPKCGFRQENGSECPRCGIIFARYRSETAPRKPGTEAPQDHPRKAIGPFRKIYRVFRWAALILLIFALFLMLRTSPPPSIVSTPEAAKRAEDKIEEFQSAIGQGVQQRLEMDEEELNGWLSRNLALKKDENSERVPPQTPDSFDEIAGETAAHQPAERISLEQAKSSVRDLKIELLEDSLRIYALFELHGMDLSLELEGQPVVRNGYIRLEPTAGKLGSLPLTSGTLKSATNRLFDSPQNRERFRLPPDIRDIRIEHGNLVIVSR
ncbi:MAG: hypothetical protein JXA73_10360 [Acidobacteria bacterium]|nr:hypothetical protein [Acidobacteriota bacterium]